MTFLLLGVLLAAVGYVFASPWRDTVSAAGPDLARYYPQQDGSASLSVLSGPDGQTVGWRTENVVTIPPVTALGEWDSAIAAALRLALLAGDEEVSDEALLRRAGIAEAIEVHQREVAADGSGTSSVGYYVRDSAGVHQVAFHNAETQQTLTLSPPALAFPADLSAGRSWDTEGALSNGALYAWSARVVEQSAFDALLGSFDDCLLVESEVVISDDTGARSETARFAEWLCTDAGVVESREFDGDGGLTQRRETVSAGAEAAPVEDAPPAVDLADDRAVLGDGADWVWSRVGRVRPTGMATDDTVAPLYLPTEPPALVATALGGDIVAFEATGRGQVRWRFHPKGSVYGQPVLDPATGRIFFGATDKRLYAIDARGLFLWSVSTGDSVVTRPLVLGDTVVFGSEDRRVYAVDAATGTLRWEFVTGGAVVSSPAHHDGVVAIGSEDQAVYGIDAASGRRRWLHIGQGAVEAGIAVADGVFYVASTDGTVTALRSDSGAQMWTTALPARLRTSPLVLGSRLYVTGEDGRVRALDRDGGRLAWTGEGHGYVGSPTAVGAAVALAREDGVVELVDGTGQTSRSWDAGDAKAGRDPDPTFGLGVAAGGGALWAIDGDSVVRRLGSPLTGEGPVPLEPSWLTTSLEVPFEEHALGSTAAEYDGRALLLDSGANAYLVDPASGVAENLGNLGVGQHPLTGATVDGDVLVVAVGDTLHGFDLPDLRLRWKAKGTGDVTRPAAVAGNTALWVTARPAESATPRPATLHAIDLRSGTVRWQADLGDVVVPGGVAVRGDTVFTGDGLAAFDLDSGSRRWQATVPGVAGGTPAVERSGTVVYGSTYGEAEDQSGGIVAVDAATGALLWHVRTEGEVASLGQPLWVDGGNVIVPLLGGDVLALDADSGVERWRHHPPAPRFGGILAEGGRVWVVSDNGHVEVLGAGDGSPVARYADVELPLKPFNYLQRPAAVQGHAVIPMGMYVSAFPAPAPGHH